jgi:hypothetical protein
MRGTANYVGIIYSSSQIPRLGDWNRGNLIIFIARDNTSYSPARTTQVAAGGLGSCDTTTQPPKCTTVTTEIATAAQTVMKNISVSGHPGVGYDPQGEYGIGVASWWSAGVHYTIIADIPLSSLILIAESMKT